MTTYPPAGNGQKPNSALITTGLDSAFRQLTAGRREGVSVDTLPGEVQRKIRAQMASPSPTVDSLVARMYNPFVQRLALEEPKSWMERVRWKRYFFQTHPLVGSAITLHAEYPISNFHIQHEDTEIREFFEDVIDELDLVEFLVELALEYWLIGEVTPFGFFDSPSNPQMWTGFILLNPIHLEVMGSDWVEGTHKEKIILRLDETVQKLVQNAGDPRYKELASRLPPDVVQAVKTGQGLMLNDIQCSRIKSRGASFTKRGTSPVDRVFRSLMYADKLKAAQYAIADRHIAPLEVWKLGETGDPADQSEIEAFRQVLSATWNDINKCVVYHHAVQLQVEGAQGKILPIWPELEQIEKEVLTGLMLSASMISGEGPSFATSVVAYDVLISRWLAWRQRLEKWIRRCVFGPLCKIHKMYVPEMKIKSLKYRTEAGLSRPLWIPEIRWERQHLKDENAKLTILVDLASKGLVPWEYVYDLMEFNAETVEDMMEKETIRKAQRAKRLADRLAKMGLPMPPPPGGEGGATQGLPSADLGGGGGDAGLPPPMEGEDQMAGLPEVVPGTNEQVTGTANPNQLPGSPGSPVPQGVGKMPSTMGPRTP